MSRKDFSKIEKKSNASINGFCYENNLADPIYISNESFENCVNILKITNENKSHYLHIKDCNKSLGNKTKNKDKKLFCKYFLQCFSSKKVLQGHKETCLKINGSQTVKLINLKLF